ncbi:sensor histidine kinase [Streptomyces aureoverticillatus]|uniref:sensor histidine kinase n=1 Tax=Streptomyces aureoverticillatus TaxID=66871 RepID=UPI0013DAC019|nr:HAMP domain-containing sensor histidine kinase [Streptomyces aureoverticillatus]QIB41782.1 HAMP domain-containing histidine kinase [Streptomyces aureoverticillatus]
MRALRRLGGLRTRLVVAFVLVALVSAVTATALAYRESRTAVLERKQDAVLTDVRNRVEQAAADFDVPADEVSLTRFAAGIADGLGDDAVVVTQYRSLKASSDASADRTRITPSLREAVRTRNRMSFQRVDWHGSPYLVVGTPVTFDSTTLSGLDVFAITSLRAERDDTAGVLDAVRDGIVPVVLLAAVLALLAAGTVLRPVRELGRATRRHAAGDLTSRVRVRGRDELADLARDFNKTASALESSVAELREQDLRAKRFVADVSHELRTPLAAMTMVATVLDEDAETLPPDAAHAARTVSEETARLTRLVDDLMEMSRFDSGAARLNLTGTDLAEAVRATLSLRALTDRVRAELPQGIRALVDRRRVDVIVANLVGNALRHGAEPVTVTLATDPAGDWLTVEVADRGPGLPPETLTHVFDRFYKADTARTRSEGSGLGTAIALENARLHGGTIDAANRPDGGAVFTLRLPWRRVREEEDR